MVGRGESGGSWRAALALGFFFVGLLGGAPGAAFAQTPAAPSDPSQPQQPGQPQGQQPTEPAPPAATDPTTIPLRQFPVQDPGRIPPTPATPPSTTLPLWTPPVPPPPSQTNVPAPYPGLGTPGAFGGGAPGLAVPGAFAPTLTTVRGALLEFHPTARASLEYSDNFFQTTSRSQDNLRSTLGPGFLLLLNGARTFGTLSTTVDLIHDTASGTGDDLKVFPSLNLALRYALTPRLALTLTDTFVRNDSPTTDEFGLRRGRETFITNTAGLSVDWLVDQWALQGYYRNVLFKTEDSGNRATTTTGGGSDDSLTHVLGLNAGTRIAIDYLVRVGYELSRTDSDGGVGGGGGGGGTSEDGSTSHTGFAQVSRQFGLYTTAGVQTSYSFQTAESTKIWNGSVFGAYGLPSGISVSGSVGYSLLNSDVESNEGTVTASLRASYRFAGRAMVSVGIFRDFRQTAQSGQDFGTVSTTSYFGSFLYQFTPFINLTLSASYNENEPTGTGNATGGSGANQTNLTYGASLNWQLLRWLSANLQYTHIRQTGDRSAFTGGIGANGNFSENRVLLALFATF